MAQAGPVRYAECDSLQIAYQVVGDGPVDILYVPGLANHIEGMWDLPEMARFTERLAEFSRLILMDKRGTGLSDPLPGDQRSTVEARMHDVQAVLDAVDSPSAYLFGTADGTPVAMVAAASYPDRIAGLVLYAASARLLEDDGYPGVPEASVPEVERLIATTWGSEDNSSIDTAMPSVAADPRWRAGWARIGRRSCTPRAAAEYWSLNMHIDVRKILDLIDVPTLVTHCTGDQVYPVGHGRYVAEHIAEAQFVELPGTDHFFFAENGERLPDEIEEFVTGQRSGTAGRRRLATVLFTDVVESTARDVQLGDRRWRALLEAHDKMVAAQVERHRGQVVKATGDGCLAVFDGPQAAIAAGLGIKAGAGELGLEIRAGIHSGEIEQRDVDVAGVAVHTASRVMTEAHPDEVCVSRTVVDLVAGSGIEFEDRGTRELKGLPGERQLFKVTS